MTARQLMLPANRAFNSNGLAVPGAVAKLYTTGTLTPANFYSTSALSVSLGSSITANAAGRFDAAYGDDTIPYRLIVETPLGVELDDIDPYYFGSTYGSVIATANTNAATRVALAALTGVTRATVTLSEAGRAGVFVFYTAADYLTQYGNTLTSQVTLDTTQAIHVAPTADTTGASGAWVRQYTGPVDIRWFGGKADGTSQADTGPELGTYGATDNATALNAALALLSQNEIVVTTENYYRAGAHIHFPGADGVYDFNSRIEVRASVRITGDGIGQAGGVNGTYLRWRPGMHGMVLLHYGATISGTVSPAAWSAGGTSIEGVQYADTYHGLWSKVPFSVSRCGFTGWAGNGIHVEATAGGGGATEGNANLFRIRDSVFYSNEHGIFVDGADVNAGLVEACDCNSNRGYGVYDSSFLGNLYIACHADANGVATAQGSTGISTMGSFGGNAYAVVVGQAAGASTNSPKGSTVTITIASPGVVSWNAHGLIAGTPVAFATTGALPTGLAVNTTYYVVSPGANDFQVAATLGGAAINTTGTQSGVHTLGVAADNTWWNYLFVGGATAARPLWVSGMTWREGGAFRSDDANARNTFLSCYSEATNGPSHLVAPATAKGGIHGARITGSGVTEFGGTWSQLTSNGNLLAYGSTHALGPISGTATDTTVALDNTNSQTTLNLRSYSGGVPQIDAQLLSIRALGWASLRGAAEARLGTTGGGDFLSVTASGAAVTGVVTATSTMTATGYKVGANTVVGAQGAAVADATDAASAITQLNLALARLRAHGLIAT
jgi:hypothetical protein